jgi:hypothetical protein
MGSDSGSTPRSGGGTVTAPTQPSLYALASFRNKATAPPRCARQRIIDAIHAADAHGDSPISTRLVALNAGGLGMHGWETAADVLDVLEAEGIAARSTERGFDAWTLTHNQEGTR